MRGYAPEEVDAFVKDTAPDAYAKLVDRLLASPHYGERMAIGWLDVVRFADTIGYHSDTPRNVWPYRDYVIRSFNQNKPFDRFTLEQVAGDLLPDSDQEAKIGSGFNDTQRLNPPKIGTIVTYKYQNLSDAGIPRFPIFLRECPKI